MVPLRHSQKPFVQGVGDPLIALVLIRRRASQKRRQSCRVLSDEPPSIHDQFEFGAVLLAEAPR